MKRGRCYFALRRVARAISQARSRVKTFLKRLVKRLFRRRRRRCRLNVPTSPCLFLRLGLDVGATRAEVQSAFCALLEEKPPPPVQKLLEEAYYFLVDDAKREIYVLTRRGLEAHGLSPMGSRQSAVPVAPPRLRVEPPSK